MKYLGMLLMLSLMVGCGGAPVQSAGEPRANEVVYTFEGSRYVCGNEVLGVGIRTDGGRFVMLKCVKETAVQQ